MDGADQDAITSLLTKMAVDRSCNSCIQDAREALINSNIDLLNAFRVIHTPPYPGLFIPHNNRLLPLYTLALLKHVSINYLFDVFNLITCIVFWFTDRIQIGHINSYR